MSPIYASQQPSGHTNRIEHVAIFGASGQMGRHITEELLKSGSHIITVITRKNSSATFPSGVTVKSVDYDDESSLVAALTGQQFVIVTLAHMAGNETHSKIVRAAAKASVPYIMPNVYGCDIVLNNKALGDEVMMGKMLRPMVEEVETLGASSYTVLVTSFWYEFSMASPPEWFGFDLNKRQVTLFDDGSRRINTSTWAQCGRAVAGLLSLPEFPQDENDSSVTLATFRNAPLYVSSFFTNQREMFESLKRVTGTQEQDWEVRHETTQERIQDGQARMATGDMKGMAQAYYSRMFSPGNEGTYQEKLHNGLFKLPTENIDEATKRAVDMAAKGWSPF